MGSSKQRSVSSNCERSAGFPFGNFAAGVLGAGSPSRPKVDKSKVFKSNSEVSFSFCEGVAGASFLPTALPSRSNSVKSKSESSSALELVGAGFSFLGFGASLLGGVCAFFVLPLKLSTKARVAPIAASTVFHSGLPLGRTPWL